MDKFFHFGHLFARGKVYESKKGITKIASLMKIMENIANYLVPLMSLLFQAIANIISSIKVVPNMGTTSHTKVFYSKPIALYHTQ